MATKSNNLKGNPYHDEKTGKFTSAGLGAVNDQIEGKGLPSDKIRRAEADLRKSGVYGMKPKHARYLVDEYISIPLLMKHKDDIAFHLMSENLRENTDDGLDKIGVDLIGWNGKELPLTAENLGQFNFIDVKTSYHDQIGMTVFEAMPGGGGNKPFISETSVINPFKKVNNAYVFQFLSGGDGLSTKKKLEEFERVGRNIDEFERAHDFEQEIYALSASEVKGIIGSFVGENELKKLCEDCSSYFDDNGRLMKEGFTEFLITHIGVPKRMGGNPNQRVCVLEDPEWGMSLEVRLDYSLPFCGISTRVNIGRKHLQERYAKNKC